ncbi:MULTISPECIES: TonB-dependent receptor domain-containing protein [unclassified Sphingopyxis]|uniref:TonB-dependent receptor domain-containing protein n=1 Tax=unclassified Sphingopyxis TaxID=2614943 RepID=UPI001E3FB4F7|nr:MULTISPECIES: TonB-dependent receptor [unclassified Sphingopyxis]
MRKVFLSGVAVGCLALSANAASARDRVTAYKIPAQSLDRALRDFGLQSGMTIMGESVVISGKTSAGFSQRADAETALRTLLRGTGLSYRRDGDVFVVTQSGNANPAASAAPAAAEIEDDNEIIVTAQKREEKIIDVPIAMTAMSAQALDDRKIEGGSELLRAVPNVSFSKSNFSMYNFSIRGIGTKAISASSDPAVAVSFNNTPLIRNRLFESEFFDMQRVEVLRGPQGTLYGRNATGGVVNLIPALPDASDFGLDAKVEVGNYKTMRASGMINVPLSDTLAVRVAGALTSRDGFDYNSFTEQRVNGRDLWSSRASIQWEPSDRLTINAIWQHFEEDDNRSRTGKQLCTPDPGPTMVGNTPIPESLRGRLSQGCLPGSLYDDAAYGTPNASGYAPIVAGNGPARYVQMGYPRGGTVASVVLGLRPGDPFAGSVQSRNLREIATSIDPVFRAKNDVFQGNMEFDISDGLTLVSQTAYARDRYFSMQDYNRYVSAPIFNDTTGLLDRPRVLNPNSPQPQPIDQTHASPGGIFCDPQLGCSDRMLSADLSRSRNRQWSQEFRLQSSFDGPFNFSLGTNYLDFKSQDDYFVFNNLYTFIAYNRNNRLLDGTPGAAFRYRDCPVDETTRDCVYVDPNPIGSLDEQGHNYFRSRNNVRTKSLAIFGEGYWNVTDRLKITAGIRFTRDKKRAVLYPSQLLLGGGVTGASGGTISGGYPANDPIVQRWSKPTGRLVIDWKPDWSFTDDSLVYASASRGYKGGGANPARPGIAQGNVQFSDISPTFKPEYINAFEIGTKNSFDGGRLTFNATGFFYDYKDYQVSQIVDRIALNENFDATVWGLEFEAAWRPSRAFRLDANLGYLKTRLKEGSQSIDVMNRTQGNPDWVLLRPFLQVPSNCIAPRAYVEQILRLNPTANNGDSFYSLCGQSRGFGSFNPADPLGVGNATRFGFAYDPFAPYNPATAGALVPYDPANPDAWRSQVSGAPNGGRGFFADLGGNELPNSPRVTFNTGAQYTFFLGDWDLTIRGDYYRQSKSFARIYNTNYDRLKGWDNVNVAVTLTRPESDLTFQLYVKNLFNDAPITDFFTNSDDSLLSTNVFTLDPRIIGFSAMKRF